MAEQTSELVLASKIGARIKEIRKQKEMTLIKLSESTGVAQATLSRMENGQMLGTVESHRRISETLGVALSDLYEGIDERTEKKVRHQKASEPKRVLVKRDDFRSELLIPTDTSSKKIIPALVTIHPHAKTSRDNGESGVDKFVWVLEGNAKLAFKNAEYELGTGDSIYFDASAAHQFENRGSQTAKLLVVSSR